MRINELRAREDFDRILYETLEASLGDFCGRDIGKISEVSASPGGQVWRAHNLLSAYCTDELVRAGRRFLADQLRFTPVAWRAPAQWVLGTALASRMGLRVAGVPGFQLSHAIPDSGRYLIIPGNRRIRLFDFQRGVTRTVAKAGFDADSIEREVMVRAHKAAGPFPSIDRVDPDGRWFDERILVGYALPRCPPWRGRQRWERRAKQQLASWLDASAGAASFDDYLSELLKRIDDRSLSLDTGSFIPANAVSRLASGARSGLQGRELAVALTHGDFQPGNIFVDTAAGQAVLVDWEFAAQRQRAFDGFVYELKSRFPAGLADRVTAYVRVGPPAGASLLLPSATARGTRESFAALFLLEELEWHLHAMNSAEYERVPPGTRAFCVELDRLLRGGALAASAS